MHVDGIFLHQTNTYFRVGDLRLSSFSVVLNTTTVEHGGVCASIYHGLQQHPDTVDAQERMEQLKKSGDQ